GAFDPIHSVRLRLHQVVIRGIQAERFPRELLRGGYVLVVHDPEKVGAGVVLRKAEKHPCKTNLTNAFMHCRSGLVDSILRQVAPYLEHMRCRQIGNQSDRAISIRHGGWVVASVREREAGLDKAPWVARIERYRSLQGTNSFRLLLTISAMPGTIRLSITGRP